MAHGTSGGTAFVLAGGGSFGAIQVGMLRELVAHGVQPDLVVGSSVGALNGAYFSGNPTAAGVARLEGIWRGLKRRDVFPVTLRRLAGLFFESAFLVDPGGLRRLIEPIFPIGTWRTPLHRCTSRQPTCSAVLQSCCRPALSSTQYLPAARLRRIIRLVRQAHRRPSLYMRSEVFLQLFGLTTSGKGRAPNAVKRACGRARQLLETTGCTPPPNRQRGRGQAVDLWTMRSRAPAAAMDNSTELPTASAFDHNPTAFYHHVHNPVN